MRMAFARDILAAKGRILAIMSAMALLLGGFIAQGDGASLAVRLQCGPFFVQTTKPYAAPGVVVTSKGNQILKTIPDAVTDPKAPPVSIEKVECHNLTSGPVPNLLVAEYTGGAHCCTRVQIYSMDPIRRILLYDAHSFMARFDVRRGADNHRILVLSDGHLDYFDNLCHACSPESIPLIICFLDKRVSDCTDRYPNVVMETAAFYTEALKRAVKEDPSKYPESVKQTIKGMALGVYATYMLMGRESQGLNVVDGIVSSPDVIKWILLHRETLRQWFASRGATLLTP